MSFVAIPLALAPTPRFSGFESGHVLSTLDGGIWKPCGPVARRFACGHIFAQSEVVRDGMFAANVTLHPGDIAEGNETERAELDSGIFATIGVDRYYGWSLLIPTGFEQADKRLVIAQWKQGGRSSDSSPPLSLRYQSGNWTLVQRLDAYKPNGTQVVYPLPHFPLGTWADLVVHTRFSKAADGAIGVWVNGSKVVDIAGQQTALTEGSDRFYHKLGLYRDQSPTSGVWFTFVDNYEIGSTRADADPATFGERHPRPGRLAALAPPPPAWSPRCSLASGALSSQGDAAAWFADVGEKIFLQDAAPTELCGDVLRLAGARGEHVTFQVAVRAAGPAPLQGVRVALELDGVLGNASVLRAAFTNVTTPANNVTSKGRGMYPDPLLDPADAVKFPGGGGMVPAGTTAAFWLTLPIQVHAAAGVHHGSLTVLGAGVRHDVQVTVYDLTLPDAAHASQWTESDPFGSLQACNTLAVASRPPGCPVNHTDYPRNMHPCLARATVDAYYEELAAHRINRLAWAYEFDFSAPVGLLIANDTQSVVLDTTAFDATFEKLLGLGFKDIRFPTPACLSGSMCGINSAAGISPNHSWVFDNSSGGCPRRIGGSQRGALRERGDYARIASAERASVRNALASSCAGGWATVLPTPPTATCAREAACQGGTRRRSSCRSL
jgi:hypothetical protein